MVLLPPITNMPQSFDVAVLANPVVTTGWEKARLRRIVNAH